MHCWARASSQPANRARRLSPRDRACLATAALAVAWKHHPETRTIVYLQDLGICDVKYTCLVRLEEAEPRSCCTGIHVRRAGALLCHLILHNSSGEGWLPDWGSRSGEHQGELTRCVRDSTRCPLPRELVPQAQKIQQPPLGSSSKIPHMFMRAIVLPDLINA
jgi:hypothetical protein